MLNVVNKTKFRMCQTCATRILADDPEQFKRPEFAEDGKVIWRGVYDTPQCALTAIKVYSDAKKLVPEKHQELVAIFQASLRRNDKDLPTANIPVNITTVPNTNQLKRFGGIMSVREWRSKFDPEGISKKVIVQTIPENEPVEENDDGLVGNWNITRIGCKTKINQEEVDTCTHTDAGLPRNIVKGVKHLCSLAYTTADGTVATPGPITVFHKPKSEVFAIGNPQDWTGESPKFNSCGSRLLGGVPVYGDLIFIHKKDKLKLKKGGKKRAQQLKASAESMEEEEAAEEPINGEDTQPAPADATVQEPVKRKRAAPNRAKKVKVAVEEGEIKEPKPKKARKSRAK